MHFFYLWVWHVWIERIISQRKKNKLKNHLWVSKFASRIKWDFNNPICTITLGMPDVDSFSNQNDVW